MCNKIALTICTISIAITLVACSGTHTAVPSSLENIPSSKNTKVVVEKGDSYYDPQSLEEVENLSEFIVKGHLLDDAKQKLYSPESGVVVYGVTVSSLEISKVYKGKLNAGETIPIAEKYYTLDESGETTRYELGYAPSNPGTEYIFFLNKAIDSNEFMRGFYSPMVKETGRYPVLRTKDSGYSRLNLMSEKELNLVQENPETYKKIYQQVIDKYLQ